MTQVQAAELFAMIMAAFDGDVRDPEKTGPLYERFMIDLPFELTEAVVVKLISTSKWLPKISEIRQPVFQLMNTLPHIGEVLEAITGVPPGQAPQLHPVAAAALKECGGLWEFRHTRDGGRWRAEFRLNISISQ